MNRPMLKATGLSRLALLVIFLGCDSATPRSTKFDAGLFTGIGALPITAVCFDLRTESPVAGYVTKQVAVQANERHRALLPFAAENYESAPDILGIGGAISGLSLLSYTLDPAAPPPSAIGFTPRLGRQPDSGYQLTNLDEALYLIKIGPYERRFLYRFRQRPSDLGKFPQHLRNLSYEFPAGVAVAIPSDAERKEVAPGKLVVPSAIDSRMGSNAFVWVFDTGTAPKGTEFVQVGYELKPPAWAMSAGKLAIAALGVLLLPFLTALVRDQLRGKGKLVRLIGLWLSAILQLGLLGFLTYVAFKLTSRDLAEMIGLLVIVVLGAGVGLWSMWVSERRKEEDALEEADRESRAQLTAAREASAPSGDSQ